MALFDLFLAHFDHFWTKLAFFWIFPRFFRNRDFGEFSNFSDFKKVQGTYQGWDIFHCIYTRKYVKITVSRISEHPRIIDSDLFLLFSASIYNGKIAIPYTYLAEKYF